MNKIVFKNITKLLTPEYIQKNLKLTDKNKTLLLKKYSAKNILKNHLISQNLNYLKKALKSENYDIIQFCEIMLQFFDFQNYELIFLIRGLKELFKKVLYEFGDENKINFKNLINYALKDLKNLKYISFKLNKHKIFLDENEKPKNRNFLKNLYFKSPIIDGKKNLNYITILRNSLKTNAKAFKSPVKICIYNNKFNIFLITLEGKSSVSIFKNNCIFIKELIPRKSENEQISLISIAFSQDEKRVCCLLKDNSISIWDFPNSDYELNIELPIKNLQIDLFFSKIYKKFCTMENNFVINVWDINDIKNREKIEINKIDKVRSKICNFVEILSLDLFLISTSEKEILIYDTKEKIVVLEKKLKVKNVLDLIFSLKYHAIILICHDINIPILKLENKNNVLEINFIGKLIGHLHFLVSACFIENKGVLVTIDENAIIKFWDIQKMCCIKSIEIMGKAFIKRIFYINQTDSLALISKKINIYKIKNNNLENKNEIQNSILDIYIDKVDKIILVFRKFELIIMDSETGRSKEIKKYNKIKNNLINTDIEASFIKIINKGKNFYLGDMKGNIYLFNLDFKLKYKLKKHSRAVKKIFINKDNTFLTFSKNEYFVQFSKKDHGFRENIILRKLKNIFQNEKPLSIIEFNLKMNLILISNKNNEIIIIDFEFGRIYGLLKFPNSIKVLDVKTYSRFGFVLIYLSDNRIILLEYNFDFFVPGFHVKLDVLDVLKNPVLNGNGALVTSCLRFKKFEEFGRFGDFNYILGFESGKIVVVSFSCRILELNERKKWKKNYLEKNSFNSRRTFNGGYGFERKNNIKVFDVEEEIRFSKLKGNVFFAFCKGFKCFDSGIGFLKIVRQKEDLILSVSKVFRYLFKMHDLDGNCILSYNLLFPLPLKWKFKYDYFYYKQKEILKSNKIIEKIISKKNSKAFFLLAKKFDFKSKKINKFSNNFYITNSRNNQDENEDKENKNSNIITMKEVDPIILLDKKYQHLYKEKKVINLKKIGIKINYKKKK